MALLQQQQDAIFGVSGGQSLMTSAQTFSALYVDTRVAGSGRPVSSASSLRLTNNTDDDVIDEEPLSPNARGTSGTDCGSTVTTADTTMYPAYQVGSQFDWRL